MIRRKFLASTAVVVAGSLAGCSGGDSAEHSGTVSTDAMHNVETSTGDTIRVEAETVEGPTSVVTIQDPDDETVLQERVDTEATLTHTVEVSGAHRVFITPTGTTSYEIYVDTEG